MAQWLAYLLPDPAAVGSIPNITKDFSEENIINVAEVKSVALVGGKWTLA